MTLSGHFDGSRIVLDEPVPAGVAPQTRVSVIFESAGTTGLSTAADVLKGLTEYAVEEDGLPADFAEHHEYYAKGSPRR